MTSTRTTRLTRSTLAAVAAGGLLTAGGLGAALAPAHTPAGSASCSGITGTMRNAPDDFTSTIKLYVGGDLVGSETAKGNHSITRSIPDRFLDTSSHSWKVVVDAGQYSGGDSGTFGPCKDKPTEPPATTHTPEPTPTEPEDTPSPSHTPTPPASTATPAPPTSPAPTTPGSATPSSTPTPDIGTPTSSTNPPTSTPPQTHTPTPSTPATPHSTPPSEPFTPSTPHVSKPHSPRTAPHCKITDTDRNADCQPDIGGPDSDVVEEGF